jgi:hypothetical protein
MRDGGVCVPALGDRRHERREPHRNGTLDMRHPMKWESKHVHLSYEELVLPINKGNQFLTQLLADFVSRTHQLIEPSYIVLSPEHANLQSIFAIL